MGKFYTKHHIYVLALRNRLLANSRSVEWYEFCHKQDNLPWSNGVTRYNVLMRRHDKNRICQRI